MGLEDEYPKANRKDVPQWRSLLAKASELGKGERELLAISINDITNLAEDLSEIRNRLLQSDLSETETGELLIAFQLTSDAMCVATETLNGKLFDVGDSLKESPAVDQA